MKQVKRLIIGLALLAGLVLGVSFLLPQQIRVARAIEINSGEEQILPFLVRVKDFNLWSPWAIRDSNARYTYSGPEEGVGGQMTWQSEVFGVGTLKIVKVEAPGKVNLQLDFGDEGTALSGYRLQPVRSGTRVEWRFQTDIGANPFARWAGVLMERAVGKDYEEGLQRLKALVEKGAP